MSPLPTQLLTRVLDELGFVADGAEFVRGDIVGRLDAGWLSFRVPAQTSLSAIDDGLGRPGLWKLVHTAADATLVGELPVALLLATSGGDDDEASAVLSATVKWALSTFDASSPGEWAAPDLESVKSLLPAGALTLQAGGHARQGELILTPTRLALRFPVLFQIPPDLPRERFVWLRETVIAAQRRRRFVRLGFLRENDLTSLHAELDFTGAPIAALPALFLAGIDALRGVVSWLLPGADLCADVTVTPRAFEVCAPEPATNERTDP